METFPISFSFLCISEALALYVMFGKVSCTLKVLLRNEEGLSSVRQISSLGPVSKPLNGVSDLDTYAFDLLPNVDDAFCYGTQLLLGRLHYFSLYYDLYVESKGWDEWVKFVWESKTLPEAVASATQLVLKEVLGTNEACLSWPNIVELNDNGNDVIAQNAAPGWFDLAYLSTSWAYSRIPFPRDGRKRTY